MTTEQLYDIIKIQQDEINQLRHELNSLKEWSDLNDYWLREMIDALTDSVDDLSDNHCHCEAYKQRHARHQMAKEKARAAGEEYREWRCLHSDDED